MYFPILKLYKTIHLSILSKFYLFYFDTIINKSYFEDKNYEINSGTIS